MHANRDLCDVAREGPFLLNRSSSSAARLILTIYLTDLFSSLHLSRTEQDKKNNETKESSKVRLKSILKKSKEEIE